MSRGGSIVSGRKARRQAQFGPDARKKGAGWTRSYRKGREKRGLEDPTEEQLLLDEAHNDTINHETPGEDAS